MRIHETNSGSSPVTVAQMEANLRLPSGFDTALITRLIAAATSYAEKLTNIAMRAKTVKASFLGTRSIYDLKYLVNAVTSVKVDGEDVDAANYSVYKNSNPGYLVFENVEYEDDALIEIEYTVTATTDNEALNEAVIAYASALYNNPEGLGQLDKRRFDSLFTTITQ